MKILSIGNSFSSDAHRYIHRLAAGEGVKLKTVNLYIGGCSLRTHYLNMLTDARKYTIVFNGVSTGFNTSLSEALASDEWDVITLQQASINSGIYDTYTPYITELAAYVRKYCPKAKIMIHQTWAYEDGSQKLIDLTPFNTADEMLAAIRDAYTRAAHEINADGIIPAGEAMMAALHGGIQKIHRDTFHASLGAGRYLLALVWFKTLTGKDISNNSFAELDEQISDEERKIIIDAVNSI